MQLAFFFASCALVSAGPCDIFAASNSPCVAAHSLVRALYANYNGPLYQLRRQIDNATFDVGVLETGGFANATAQEACEFLVIAADAQQPSPCSLVHSATQFVRFNLICECLRLDILLILNRLRSPLCPFVIVTPRGS